MIRQLASQYCSFSQSTPVVDHQEQLDRFCTLFSGVLTGNRVYWAWCKSPLPSELPIDPNVLQQVESQPFFAGAPAILMKSYHIDTVSTSYWKQGGSSGSANSTSSDEHSIRELRRGLASENWATQAETRMSTTTSTTPTFTLGLGGQWIATVGIATGKCERQKTVREYFEIAAY